MDIPLLVVDNKDQVAATQHLLSKCREYILGLKMEIARKEMPKVKRRGGMERYSCPLPIGYT